MNKFFGKRSMFLLIAMVLSVLTFLHFTQDKPSTQAEKRSAVLQARQEAKIGDKYYDAGKLDLAAQQYEKSLSLDKNRDNKFILANIYLRSGKKELALSAFKELSSGTDDNAKIARDTLKDLSK